MPKVINPRRTWKYKNEFKVKAVQFNLQDSVQVKDAKMDTPPFMLSRWRKEHQEGKLVADDQRGVFSFSFLLSSAQM